VVGFFIQRPIFASAIAAILVLAGAICFFLLPVSQFPEITPPQVVVSANYPGASAQVVADTVTTPLEQQINGVEGMTYMSSASSNDGSSTITVTFKVGYPLNIAAVDVQNRVSQAASSLPAIVIRGGDDQEAESELRSHRQSRFAGPFGRFCHPVELRLSANC
jgi:multidrug efflux pump subunit AcrB